MKRRSRAILGGLGTVAGIALVAFEVGTIRAARPVESWFWLLVGVLVATFGALAFLGDGNKPQD